LKEWKKEKLETIKKNTSLSIPLNHKVGLQSSSFIEDRVDMVISLDCFFQNFLAFYG
jgi:hypothetical protein